MKKILLLVALCIFLSCSGSQQSVVKQDQQGGSECAAWEDMIKKQEYQEMWEESKQKAREKYFADCMAKKVKAEDYEKEYNRFLISALEIEKADVFEGRVECVYGNCQDGLGIYIWPSGEKYTGQWKDSLRNGEGNHVWPSGSKYSGQWKDDKRDGEGTYAWQDGEKYTGQWQDGKIHGKGTYSWPDGAKYTGQWKDDKRYGEGTYNWQDGKKYTGPWEDSKMHGEGILYGPDGEIVHKGNFKNGEYIAE